MFIRAKLDDCVTEEIDDGVRDAIIGTRVSQAGLDRARGEDLTTVGRRSALTVSAEGEGRTSEVLNQLIPMALMGLLLMSVLMSGQCLLTTTIEEKSNRVVEVLLSAVADGADGRARSSASSRVGLLVLALVPGPRVDRAALVRVARLARPRAD